MPRTIEVELTGCLVDAAAAGDAVTVVGWVKVIAADPAAAGTAPRQQCNRMPELCVAQWNDRADADFRGSHAANLSTQHSGCQVHPAMFRLFSSAGSLLC